MTFPFERQARWQQRLAELEAVIAELKAENEKAAEALSIGHRPG
jgi:hypothetical protein